MKAYFTVEAAFLLPVVLGIYALLIWSMLWIHDRSIADQEIALLAMRGVLAYEGNELKGSEKEIAQVNKDRFLIFHYEDINMKAYGNRLTAEGKGRARLFLKVRENREGKEEGMLSFSYTNRKLSPAKIIRLSRRLIEGIRED